MVSLIRSIIVAGADLDAHRRRYVVNTNVYALLAIVVSFPYPFIYLYLRIDVETLALAGVLVFISAYALVIALNALKWYSTAKLLLFATALSQLFSICVFFGAAAGLDQFLFAVFVGIFFVIDRHKKKLILPAMVATAITYIAVQYVFGYQAPVVKMQAESARIVKYITSGTVFFVLGLQCLYFYWGNERAEIALEKAHADSDRLLLNILPERIADELKKNGSVVPVEHDAVTVVFTDFVGFTASSEFRDPADLLRDLDDCFTAFDGIIEKFQLEKLKTIGDAYMFAGGVPTDLDNHAVRAVEAALEIIKFVAARRVTNDRFWQIRVGVHTGRLVAGVIGRKKFIYDVWGDTVNTASRLEAAGEPGRINISQATYDLVKEKISCTFRGEIAVKGKKPLGMYFIDGV